MRAYYVVSPEVAGEIGPLSDLDTSVHPPSVRRLNYVFMGWLGDDIVESFPIFLVTEALSEAIMSSGLSGAEFDDVIVTKDPQFEEVFPEAASSLPAWRWLRPVGQPHVDDFWQDEAAHLTVSENALDLLQQFRFGHAEYREL